MDFIETGKLATDQVKFFVLDEAGVPRALRAPSVPAYRHPSHLGTMPSCCMHMRLPCVSRRGMSLPACCRAQIAGSLAALIKLALRRCCPLPSAACLLPPRFIPAACSA